MRDTLCPRFKRNWIAMPLRLKAQKRTIVTLSNFSFSRNPTGTFKQIRDVARAAAKCLDVRINFTDKRCDDVAPYIVLSHLMRALPPVFSGGLINKEVAAVIESVGLDRLLGVNRLTRQESDFPILPFKMAFRAPPGFFGDKEHQLRPQHKEYIADRFCSALDEWLETEKFELTPDGAQAIINSITEALDNAERHGCPDVDGGMGDWSMGGFSRLVRDENGNQRLECSVSIVSVGSTISDSLKTASPKVSQLIDGYVALQRANHGLDDELARCIVALQDGITRVEAASDAKRGGIGLLELAEFFADLGETNRTALQSVFTILSGNACLRITTPYRRGVRYAGTTMRKLWFNPTNDGTAKPDANHAFMIDDKFPGTVLSACFCIDPTYLQQKLAG